MQTEFLSCWKRVLMLIAAGMLSLNAAESDNETRAAERLMAEKRPLVIAHRGYSALAPENTLPAFQYAIAAGADLVELDYHHSQEGTPIVIHDYTVDRTTDRDERWGGTKIEVKTKTVQELQTLDAGKWFNPQFAGTKVPLLTEALELIQKHGVTLIERKAGDAATCVSLLRERDLVNRLVVQSFDWSYLADFHKQEPRQILGALGPQNSYGGKKLSDEEKILTPRWNDEVKRTGAQLVVWNKQITKEAVQDAHKKGLKVWVYTINDAALANQLLDLAIDGIITDNPSLIWRALALRTSTR